MKTYLVLLKNPIIISDEKKNTFDKVWNDDVLKILTVSNNMMPHGSKIIAGLENLPVINFNGFEKDLNLFQAEYEAIKKYPKDEFWIGSGESARLYDQNARDRIAFIEGFKTANKLSEKKFTYDDLEKVFLYAQEQDRNSDGSYGFSHIIEHLEWYSKYLLKPKTIEVEVELNVNEIKIIKIV